MKKVIRSNLKLSILKMDMETKEPEVFNNQPVNDYFLIMRHFIRDFWYLERTRWFLSNVEIQNKLLLTIRLGLYSKVYVATPDLNEHLDFILSEYYEMKDCF
jgi:hypothetical protein